MIDHDSRHQRSTTAGSAGSAPSCTATAGASSWPGWPALAAVLALTPAAEGHLPGRLRHQGLGVRARLDRARAALRGALGRHGHASSGRRLGGAQAPADPGARAALPRRQAERVEGIGSRRVRSASRPTARSPAPRWSSTAACGTSPTRPARSSSTWPQRASGDGLTVALGGGPIRMAEGGGGPEGFGLLGAAVVLLIAFGSIVAAGLPLAIALVRPGHLGRRSSACSPPSCDVPDFAPADRRACSGSASASTTRCSCSPASATALDGGADVRRRARRGRRHGRAQRARGRQHRAHLGARPLPHGRRLPPGRGASARASRCSW